MNRKFALGISIAASFVVSSVVLGLLSSAAQAVGAMDDSSLGFQLSIKKGLGYQGV